MDQNIVNKDKLLLCIKNTNIVLQRWIHENNVSPNNITNAEVLSIFKGCIKKHLVQYVPDFKRVSNMFRVHTDHNRFITDVKMLYVEHTSFRTNTVVNNIYTIVGRLTSQDYLECKEIKNDENNKVAPSLELLQTEIELLNFESIKSIKF